MERTRRHVVEAIEKFVVGIVLLIILAILGWLAFSYCNVMDGALDPTSTIDMMSVKTWLMIEGENYSDMNCFATCLASHF